MLDWPRPHAASRFLTFHFRGAEALAFPVRGDPGDGDDEWFDGLMMTPCFVKESNVLSDSWNCEENMTLGYA